MADILMAIFGPGINALVLLEPITHLSKVLVVALKQTVNDMIYQRRNFRKQKVNGMKIK